MIEILSAKFVNGGTMVEVTAKCDREPVRTVVLTTEHAKGLGDYVGAKCDAGSPTYKAAWPAIVTLLRGDEKGISALYAGLSAAKGRGPRAIELAA